MGQIMIKPRAKKTYILLLGEVRCKHELVKAKKESGKGFVGGKEKKKLKGKIFRDNQGRSNALKVR